MTDSSDQSKEFSEFGAWLFLFPAEETNFIFGHNRLCVSTTDSIAAHSPQGALWPETFNNRKRTSLFLSTKSSPSHMLSNKYNFIKQKKVFCFFKHF